MSPVREPEACTVARNQARFPPTKLPSFISSARKEDCASVVIGVSFSACGTDDRILLSRFRETAPDDPCESTALGLIVRRHRGNYSAVSSHKRDHVVPEQREPKPLGWPSLLCMDCKRNGGDTEGESNPHTCHLLSVYRGPTWFCSSLRGSQR